MRVGDRGVIGGVEDVLDAFLPKIIPEKTSESYFYSLDTFAIQIITR